MPDPRFTAVLFDIDGTLVDSNYLHVDAWSRALADLDRPVPEWRIHRSIGMDSGVLLQELLGDDAERLGDDAKNLHTEHFRDLADRLLPFDDARALIQELARRGFTVVLATSAPQEEFDRLWKILDVEDAVAEYTTSEDVGTAKPAPDVIGVALDKAGIEASEAIMVGDAVWDMQSANRAGVTAIGVLSGGTGTAELTDGGAEAVYDDAAQLLDRLDDSPLYRAG